MKKRSVAALSILLFLTMLTSSFVRRMVLPIEGKWQLTGKIEQKTQNGNLTEKHEKYYKPGKKTYEFMADGKLLIAEDYGKSREKKKYVSMGNELFIGKDMSDNNKYVMTFNGNDRVTLLRTKTKTSDGKSTVETDELRLERIRTDK